MLFLIFVFGPCEVLIPLLIFPAYEIHITGMILVSLVFGAATVFTMMMIVFLGFKGIRTLKFKNSGRYFHLIAGIVIIGLGLSMKFLGW
jgi:threonine/homoserine/homoserine lactone efflux protein